MTIKKIVLTLRQGVEVPSDVSQQESEDSEFLSSWGLETTPLQIPSKLSIRLTIVRLSRHAWTGTIQCVHPVRWVQSLTILLLYGNSVMFQTSSSFALWEFIGKSTYKHRVAMYSNCFWSTVCGLTISIISLQCNKPFNHNLWLRKKVRRRYGNSICNCRHLKGLNYPNKTLLFFSSTLS